MDESRKNNEASQEERRDLQDKVSEALNIETQKINENEVKEESNVNQNEIKKEEDDWKKEAKNNEGEAEGQNLNQESLKDNGNEVNREQAQESHDNIKENKLKREFLKGKKNPMEIAVVALLSLILIVSIYGVASIKSNIGKTKVQKWEYKTIMVGPVEKNARTGNSAAKFNTINISQEELNELGNEGWELVDSYLEMETSYPNFGNKEYVTGLQSNVRPQLVKLIFKRSVVE